jgi:hypothetical protein
MEVRGPVLSQVPTCYALGHVHLPPVSHFLFEIYSIGISGLRPIAHILLLAI